MDALPIACTHAIHYICSGICRLHPLAGRRSHRSLSAGNYFPRRILRPTGKEIIRFLYATSLRKSHDDHARLWNWYRLRPGGHCGLCNGTEWALRNLVSMAVALRDAILLVDRAHFSPPARHYDCRRLRIAFRSKRGDSLRTGRYREHVRQDRSHAQRSQALRTPALSD